MRDIAEAAGVHVTTVSRVLSPERRGLVNEETARRIEALANDLGYSPNRLAQGLKTRRSMSIGVIVNDITNPVFPYVVKGIEDQLGRGDYTALVANADGDVDRERKALEALKRQQVDGLIMTTALRFDPLVNEVVQQGTPLVLAVRDTERADVATVTPDERLGTRLAVEHLWGLGHRRIACISGPTTVSTGATRLAAFMEAAKSFGLDADPSLVVEAQAFTIAEGERVMADLLDGEPAFSAVLAGNDMLAIGCIATIGRAGLRCPDDISVIGFNDMPMADRFSPPLTTLRIPYYEMGLLAADLMMEQLSERAPRQITVTENLIVRGSTAPFSRSEQRLQPAT
jgi:LacI family transcriptional regulator